MDEMDGPYCAFKAIHWHDILKASSRKKDQLIVAKLPEIDNLRSVHYERYKEKLLCKLFDYNRFIDSPKDSQESLRKDLTERMEDMTLLDSTSHSFPSLNSSNACIDQPFEDDYLSTIDDYVKGVALLKSGENIGKMMIRKAAKAGLPHALYAHSIILFKEVFQNPIDTSLDLLEKIDEAVEYMLEAGKYISPLDDFVLGVVQLYDVKGFEKAIESKSNKHWVSHFAQVLTATKRTLFMDAVAKSNVLNDIYHFCLGFVEPKSYMIMLGSDAEENLGWMVECVMLELAIHMIGKSKLSTANFLLRELCSYENADAMFVYAVALVSEVFDTLDHSIALEVCSILREPAALGHQFAMLLLGTLPYRKGFQFLRTNAHISEGKNCFRVLRRYVNAGVWEGRTYLEEAASLVAKEYLHEYRCPFVLYSEENAKWCLQENDMHPALERLERKLKKRNVQAGNMLHDVLRVLKKTCSKLRANDGLLAPSLLPIIEQIFYELQDSSVIVKQSSILSSILEQLNSSLSLSREDVLSLEQLCFVLQKHVEDQDCVLKDILRSLEKLWNACRSVTST